MSFSSMPFMREVPFLVASPHSFSVLVNLTGNSLTSTVYFHGHFSYLGYVII